MTKLTQNVENTITATVYMKIFVKIYVFDNRYKLLYAIVKYFLNNKIICNKNKIIINIHIEKREMKQKINL